MGKENFYSNIVEGFTANEFLRRKDKTREEKKLDQQIESVSLMEYLLNLFGTTAAKERFLDLCKKYRISKWRQRTSNLLKIEEQESSRAEVHNKIIDTIASLSRVDSSSESTHVFSQLGARDRVTDMIIDYFDWQEKKKLEESEFRKAA
ncbi:hypothetical protein KKD19_04175 [Patescibacteria group bacterium]|nr:hypothetical protein [Patescibacteria group bacterium]MBU4512404.1 hypothetical protein [Patescibacteria group bacterium]MCG2693178.1 hypothetical protein [Candidatus Parcubacteria bacterium]